MFDFNLWHVGYKHLKIKFQLSTMSLRIWRFVEHNEALSRIKNIGPYSLDKGYLILADKVE